MEVKNETGTAGVSPVKAASAASPSTEKPVSSSRKGPGAPPPGDLDIQKAVREALKADPIPTRELRIDVDAELKMIVVKVVDKESGEVIRQIPMPESVARAKRVKQQLSKMIREQRGFAVDKEA